MDAYMTSRAVTLLDGYDDAIVDGTDHNHIQDGDFDKGGNYSCGVQQW